MTRRRRAVETVRQLEMVVAGFPWRDDADMALIGEHAHPPLDSSPREADRSCRSIRD